MAVEQPEPRARRRRRHGPEDLKPTLWQRPENVGRAGEVRGFGGVVGTLIAGFSLAAITQLVSANDPPLQHDLAVVAFTGTSVLMLFSVQFSFLLVRHSASPEERLAWHPEAKVHSVHLAEERKRQAVDELLSRQYYDCARFFFNWGLLLFFIGLGSAVFRGDWNDWRNIAVAFAAIGFCVEAFWAATNKGLFPPDLPLRPTSKTIEREVTVFDLDETSRDALSGRHSWIDLEPPDDP